MSVVKRVEKNAGTKFLSTVAERNMRILVFNSGSSSLKFQLFKMDANAPASMLQGTVRDLGDETTCEWAYAGKKHSKSLDLNDHDEAVRYVLDLLENCTDGGQSLLDGVTAIGHRIVHGGRAFIAPALITERMLSALEVLSPLAPLHNPPALAVVRACRARLANVPMVAVFDTAFFQDLPDYVHTYALPAEWIKRPQGIRRYGFHGLAHRYMSERYSAINDVAPTSSRLITLQLGHGCSVAAIHGGRPMETSMGFTPMEGLIMATRPGDVDIGAVLHLLEHGIVTASKLSDGLNHHSGLLGLSGVSDDMQTLLVLEAQGHAGARLAVQAFCHRARKYIGAYLAVLGGADAIIFGGGIGEQAAEIRQRICVGMEWCGLVLDTQANQMTVGVEACISMADSQTQAYVIPVDEESLIAQDTLNCLNPEVTSDFHFSTLQVGKGYESNVKY